MDIAKVRQLVVIVVAVSIITSISVVPVAASNGIDTGLSPVDTNTGDTLEATNDGRILASESDDTNLPLPSNPEDIDADTNDLPEQVRILRSILQTAEIDAVGPEDSPVGNESSEANVCGPLNVESDDLPTDLLPGINDVPTDFFPANLPTEVLTNEAVLSLVLGVTPGPCEVLDPNDPPVDPTGPPDEPRSQLDIQRFGEYEHNGSQGGVALFNYRSTLNDSKGGPGVSGMHGVLITENYGDIENKMVINDSNNAYGADSRVRYNDGKESGEFAMVILGQRIGGGVNCNLQEADVDDLLITDPGEIDGYDLGPCGIKLIGIPNVVTFEDVIDITSQILEDPVPEAPENGI